VPERRFAMSLRRGANEASNVSKEATLPNDGLSGATAQALAAHVGNALADLVREPLAAGLYLVATPIGNLTDITLRALAVLWRADVIYCEDTRHSARLLDHFAISTRRRPFHEHNEEREIARTLEDLTAGKRIAVISDAGTPLVSDPGFKLVRAAAADGIPVFSIPGPSATLTALTASGLPTDAFFFAGFLPPKTAARRARLAELSRIPATLVFYEAPQRVEETLADMAVVFGDRDAVIARELTKRHEEISRGRLSALSHAIAGHPLKGEVVLLVGAPGAEVVSDEEIAARLAGAMTHMSLKDAAKAIADDLGVPKARVYALGLKAKDARS
jgi:16S rRNA (cytidine1402-2'-O)-methyltransferase